MNIYSIYTATNKTNGKVYVGFATNFHQRVKRHKALFTKSQKKLYTAIRKYGWDNFLWEEIYVSTEKEHCLNTMEEFFINQFDSINSGYNATHGGSGVLGINNETVWINNGTINKRIRQNTFLPEGWVFGRIKISRKVKMSNDSKQLISDKNKIHGVFAKLNSNKLPCPHCGIYMNLGNLSRHIKRKHSD